MSVLRKRRRSYLRADARRAQILDVAKSVFARRGYHDANVADICQAAHIGRGTLYQYFDNKRAVMLALIEEIEERVARVLDERPPVRHIPGAEKAPVEMIVAFCRQRLRQVLDAVFVDEATLRLILGEARGLDGGIDRMIAGIDRRLSKAIEGDVRAAQEIGIMRRNDPKLVARFILGALEKMVLTALVEDEHVDLDAIVKTAIDIEMFGLLSGEVRR
jgi:AcrR family transcriptional regulator